MTPQQVLDELRLLTLLDEKGETFPVPDAREAYEQMRAYLAARLSEGQFPQPGAVRLFAARLECAIYHDRAKGADEVVAEAQLAFWRRTRTRLDRLERVAHAVEAGPSAEAAP